MVEERGDRGGLSGPAIHIEAAHAQIGQTAVTEHILVSDGEVDPSCEVLGGGRVGSVARGRLRWLRLNVRSG